MIKRDHLFLASCVALTTTSLTFGIRAGMLSEWAKEFQLTNEQVGVITSMAFFGFPIATVLGGLFLDTIGMKRAVFVAFFAHIIGLLLTMFAGGFTTLLISTLFIGFANGAVEAALNPLVTTLYPDKKTTMLNRFHVWFPAGIVIGALVSFLMKKMGLDWRMQCGVILIPAIMYGVFFFGQNFPRTERVERGISTGEMFRAVLLNPLFWFLALCMMLTANTELSTGQWIDGLLRNVGINGLLVLALINGLMAAGRYFAGAVVHRFNEEGVLLGSSVFAALGLYMLSTATQPFMTIVSAIFFAIGVCYFWPTMLGYVAKVIPKGGALGLSLLGAAGMLATAVFQPIIGKWFDQNKASATSQLSGSSNVGSAELAQAIDLAAGKMTLQNVAMFPVILILAFGALYYFRRGGNK